MLGAAQWKKTVGELFRKVPILGGNNKAENHCVMVADLVQSYKAMGCNMSLRVYFLQYHFFPENLGQ